jgi:hypothetical protein
MSGTRERGNESGREGAARRAVDTALDVAIGGPALAVDKTREVAGEMAQRGEEAVRRGREKTAEAVRAARQTVEVQDASPYESRSRDELYELARERGIEGRSRMRKTELIAALREDRGA